MQIVYKLGKENVVVDFISRLSHDINDEVVDDSFPDEHMFDVTIHTPWYVDLANYLIIGNLPQHFTPNEKARLIRKGSFSWLGDYLYHRELDNVMRSCIREDEVFDIMGAFHDEPCGGHFIAKRIP